MVCTYNLFMGDRLWRTQTGERAPFWCTALIFTCTGGQYFIHILSAVENLEPTKSILQDILPLSSATIKETFIHMGGKVNYFTELKKRTVVLDIERRWGKDIIK